MRVPKEIMDQFKSLLFINDKKDISDESSRKCLEFCKFQEKKYRRILYMGMVIEIRAYKRRLKLEKKQQKLLGK